MMLHPATVHFAMVLPVVASAFGVIYLFSKTEGMAKISARTTLIAALAVIGVWYTGNQAGPQIFEYLSADGKHELLEHKQLGLYLAIAMAVIALVQIAGCRMKKFAVQALGIILLLGATGTMFLQGKHGGEIVYNYGMPFKAYMMQDSLKEAQKAAEEEDECDAQVEAYEDAIDDIDSLSEEVDAIYGNQPAQEAEEDN